MFTAVAHSASLKTPSMELVCSTADQMTAKGSTRRKNCALPIEVKRRNLRPHNFRLLSRKNLRADDEWSYRLTLSQLCSEVRFGVNSVPDDNGRCGCRAPTQFSRHSISQRASRFVRPIASLAGCDVTARADRRKRKSIPYDDGVQTDKRQPQSLRRATGRPPGKKSWKPTWAGVIADEGERGEFVPRAKVTFGFKESSGVEARNMVKLSSVKWKFISGAAAAGLSLVLSSSALASPMTADGVVHMPTTVVSENLRTHVETQLRRELQAQIKVQKNWLDDIGKPLSEWTIDDRVRRNLEDMSRTRVDESGKTVSKLEMLESEVVPLFKPLDVAQKKDKVANAGSANTQEASQEKVGAASSRGPPSVVAQPRESTTAPLIPKPAKPAADGAPEFVAVAAIPLGKVLSAASRTVGSAASMLAMQASAPAVPGMRLLTRIMVHFGGGGVAGAMGATLVYPLDTIKTRMQAQSNKDGEEVPFKDEWDCLRQLVAKEGPGSLYSGLLPQLIGVAPEKAMKLTVNEMLMEMLESEMPGVGPWALELIAGGGGGFSQVVFTNPMEIVKIRLQTQAKDVKQKNTWDVIKELGVQGLYNGSSMTMARDIPSSAIFFAIYTLIRQVYPDQSFMAGFVAAIPATVLVTPFDVVKTRIQMEKAGGQEPYENGYACFAMILQKEGIGALFKGSLARVLKTSPQFGITLMLYNILCSGS